jgi:hypothetical protein
LATTKCIHHHRPAENFAAAVRLVEILKRPRSTCRHARSRFLAFKFGERVGLQFRTEFFNLFNHTNFANPIGNQSNANFGKITATLLSAAAPRLGRPAELSAAVLA